MNIGSLARLGVGAVQPCLDSSLSCQAMVCRVPRPSWSLCRQVTWSAQYCSLGSLQTWSFGSLVLIVLSGLEARQSDHTWILETV
jgi:hypothetical protein